MYCENFTNCCKSGDLIKAKKYLELNLNPIIDIHARNEEAFIWSCAKGHLCLVEAATMILVFF
jgi:hypothetical protein